MTRRLLVSLLAAATAGTVWIGAAAGSAPPLCGSRAAAHAPKTIAHVIWIFMENKSEGAVVGSPSAPFIDSIATACGLATNYHSISHPSLPNYLAATSGDTHGVASDCKPAHCPQPGPSIFSQLQAAHKTWRSYVESMPSNCDTRNSGPYAAKHNPAAYYTGLTAACAQSDVPLEGGGGTGLSQDLAHGSLPAFSLIVPNTCDDMHSCPIASGDAWLRTWIGRIVATPAYRAGQIVVFLTWDEGNVQGEILGENCAQNPTDPGCHVAMVVLSPYTPTGTKDARQYTHYSLLLTTEQLLGLSGRLGHAGAPGTRSMRPGFHL